ncbi:hypothetical protein [Metamycoplasma hyosynoviae]|uniref:hypothetical protein n=1 Tax=Metamycoplasma hyosynoviae TaxID=29559 RepID=UPI00235A0570|nr:hypothetical protein [Metamycoplasma hyosynoviae]MDC8919916.1 hypothetical protein [Metamycoplasma hyosynoviae]MDD1372313.1 hypothetical protein [Metamycoplasma hyosynoviae]MDD7894038.1 hypothetical protein [Metamycoplasma hyosynoviae]MDD7912829.1 hypothetical protein [Metamycoplasma hyosynoviae]
MKKLVNLKNLLFDKLMELVPLNRFEIFVKFKGLKWFDFKPFDWYEWAGSNYIWELIDMLTFEEIEKMIDFFDNGENFMFIRVLKKLTKGEI